MLNQAGVIYIDDWSEQSLMQVAEKEITSNENIGLQQFKKTVCALMVAISGEAQLKVQQFDVECGKKIYFTPSNFLDLVRIYIDLMKQQLNCIPLMIKKYQVIF